MLLSPFLKRVTACCPCRDRDMELVLLTLLPSVSLFVCLYEYYIIEALKQTHLCFDKFAPFNHHSLGRLRDDALLFLSYSYQSVCSSVCTSRYYSIETLKHSHLCFDKFVMPVRLSVYASV